MDGNVAGPKLEWFPSVALNLICAVLATLTSKLTWTDMWRWGGDALRRLLVWNEPSSQTDDDTCLSSTGESTQWRGASKPKIEMFPFRSWAWKKRLAFPSAPDGWFTTFFGACDFGKEVKPFGSEWFCTSPEKQNLLLCTSGAPCFQRAAAEWTEVEGKKCLPHIKSNYRTGVKEMEIKKLLSRRVNKRRSPERSSTSKTTVSK